MRAVFARGLAAPPTAPIFRAMTNPSEREHRWLSTLVHELFQTEQSARLHPIVEADRLGDVPPSQPLRAVAAHATEALAELPPIVQRYDLPVSSGGRAIGAAFSQIRDHLADLLLSAEKSYRGTLLGMRHGVDVVELVQYTAREDGDEALANWCATWLERRRPLVEAAARELEWFARHPERACAPAKDNPLAVGLHALLSGVEQLGERLRHALPGAAKPEASVEATARDA